MISLNYLNSGGGFENNYTKVPCTPACQANSSTASQTTQESDFIVYIRQDFVKSSLFPTYSTYETAVVVVASFRLNCSLVRSSPFLSLCIGYSELAILPGLQHKLSISLGGLIFFLTRNCVSYVFRQQLMPYRKGLHSTKAKTVVLIWKQSACKDPL